MDPLSVSTSVGAISKLVYSISRTLYTFVNDVRRVDQSVEDLALEVEVLKKTLREVDSVLKSYTVVTAEKRAPTNESNQLWQTLYDCLTECRKSLVRLDSSLDGIRKARPNWAGQALRQVKLNLRTDEINSLRVQIHAHNAALMTALQMVNIRATYMAPEIVIADLGPRIDHLDESLKSLTNIMQNQRGHSNAIHGDPVPVDCTTQAKLHSLGVNILSRAATVYNSSVDGVSVYGDSAPSESLVRPENWISEVPFNVRGLSGPSVAPLRERRMHLDRTASDGLPAYGEIKRSKPSAGIIESDSEAEFETELTQGLLDKGKKLFDATNYAQALGHLQKSVTVFNRLPRKMKMLFDFGETPFMIATCKWHLNDIPGAQAVLLILLDQESSSNEDAIRQCQASHLLSQIYLMDENLEASEDYCRKALKGRRRLLGTGHPDYVASLSLLAEVCEIRGKYEEASVYRNMIPFDADHSSRDGRPRGMETIIIRYGLQQQSRPLIFSADEDMKHREIMLQFSPNGVLLSMTVQRGKSKIWNLAKVLEVCISELQKTCAIGQIAFCDEGKFLAIAERSSSKITYWDVDLGSRRLSTKGAPVEDLEVSFRSGPCLCVSPDGKRHVRLHFNKQQKVGDSRIDIRLCDSRQKVIACDFTDWSTYTFSPDSTQLAIGAHEPSVTMIDTNTGTRTWLRAPRKYPVAFMSPKITFSPDSRLVAYGRDGHVWCWDAKSKVLMAYLADVGHGFSFSPDSNLLAIGSQNGKVKFWNLRLERRQGTLFGHLDSIEHIEFSPGGKLVATASRDKTAKIWDVETGLCLSTLDGHTDAIVVVTFSPDGNLVATASEDGTVRVWPVPKT